MVSKQKGEEFMPPCPCWLFMMDLLSLQGKYRGFEEQQEGYAAYFHSFQLQHIHISSTSEQYLQKYLYRILIWISKNAIIKTFIYPP